jgi:phenylacetate-CoA ligase
LRATTAPRFTTSFRGGCATTAWATASASTSTLAQKIKDVVGISATVHVGPPGTVERSQGKARRVIDNRPKD